MGSGVSVPRRGNTSAKALRRQRLGRLEEEPGGQCGCSGIRGEVSSGEEGRKASGRHHRESFGSP